MMFHLSLDFPDYVDHDPISVMRLRFVEKIRLQLESKVMELEIEYVLHWSCPFDRRGNCSLMVQYRMMMMIVGLEL